MKKLLHLLVPQKGIVMAVVISAICALPAVSRSESQTEITWYGHSAFKVATPSGKILLIDPWITNPANKNGKEDLAAMDTADLILLTHTHGDHIGNTVEIAKKTGAQLVATFDVGRAMVQYGNFPEKQFGFSTTGNFGGDILLLDGEVKVTFTPAVHSSSIEAAESSKMPKSLMCAGNPGGFVIAVKNGPVIYNTGDTNVFSDMSFIGKYSKIDIMMACIGGKFTMGPRAAADAVMLVKPAMVMPMHYGTYSALTGTAEDFEKELKAMKSKAKLTVMKVGEKLVWKK